MNKDMWVCAVQREESFSPNSVEVDKAILQMAAEKVGDKLKAQVMFLKEEQLTEKGPISQELQEKKPTLWLSMARGNAALAFLDDREERGESVVNSPKGVRRCTRSLLHRFLSLHNVPLAPSKGTYGYWVKKGDGAAQEANDVVYVAKESLIEAERERFKKRGIDDVVVSAHVPGDLIKFYGVTGTEFFKTFYPTEDGGSKFGLECINGRPHYYDFDKSRLQRVAEKIASLVQVPIYGGDAIVDSEGKFYIIDFNDWPSFSRCRVEAAEAIASLISRLVSRDN